MLRLALVAARWSPSQAVRIVHPEARRAPSPHRAFLLQKADNLFPCRVVRQPLAVSRSPWACASPRGP